MKYQGKEMQRENQVTEVIIGCAIEVHRILGPGLLETAYEECLCYELMSSELHFNRQVKQPVYYKGVKLDCDYRLDLLVEDLVVVELKTVEKLLPIHQAQLLTYLKLRQLSVGLIINFNVPILKNGIMRIVNHFNEYSAPPRLCGEES